MYTHNRLFVENLALSLNKNRDLFLSKGFGTPQNYNAFMNSLANAMFKKEKMAETHLPIVYTAADEAESTSYFVSVSQFDSSFVMDRYDSYYFAVAFDKTYDFRVFSYELDYDSNNNIVYAICEHTKTGKRIVIEKCNTLRSTKFDAVLYNVLK